MPTPGQIAFMAYHKSDHPPSDEEWRDNPHAKDWERVAYFVLNWVDPDDPPDATEQT
jgi:hypothetical protein